MLFCIPGGVLSTQYYLILTSVHVFVCSLVSQLALNEITITALTRPHDCFYWLRESPASLFILWTVHSSPVNQRTHSMIKIRVFDNQKAPFTFHSNYVWPSYCMVTDLMTNKFRQVDGHSKIDSDLGQLKSNSGMTLRSNQSWNRQNFEQWRVLERESIAVFWIFFHK